MSKDNTNSEKKDNLTRRDKNILSEVDTYLDNLEQNKDTYTERQIGKKIAEIMIRNFAEHKDYEISGDYTDLEGQLIRKIRTLESNFNTELITSAMVMEATPEIKKYKAQEYQKNLEKNNSLVLSEIDTYLDNLEQSKAINMEGNKTPDIEEQIGKEIADIAAKSAIDLYGMTEHLASGIKERIEYISSTFDLDYNLLQQKITNNYERNLQSGYTPAPSALNKGLLTKFFLNEVTLAKFFPTKDKDELEKIAIQGRDNKILKKIDQYLGSHKMQREISLADTEDSKKILQEKVSKEIGKIVVNEMDKAKNYSITETLTKGLHDKFKEVPQTKEGPTHFEFQIVNAYHNAVKEEMKRDNKVIDHDALRLSYAQLEEKFPKGISQQRKLILNPYMREKFNIPSESLKALVNQDKFDTQKKWMNSETLTLHIEMPDFNKQQRKDVIIDNLKEIKNLNLDPEQEFHLTTKIVGRVVESHIKSKEITKSNKEECIQEVEQLLKPLMEHYGINDEDHYSKEGKEVAAKEKLHKFAKEMVEYHDNNISRDNIWTKITETLKELVGHGEKLHQHKARNMVTKFSKNASHNRTTTPTTSHTIKKTEAKTHMK